MEPFSRRRKCFYSEYICSGDDSVLENTATVIFKKEERKFWLHDISKTVLLGSWLVMHKK
jgi:hypothetical protein